MQNNLKDFLIQEIQQKGPISVDCFINHCLSNSLYGYYKTQQVIGKNADFITAPEVSQMFGEILGIWVVANFLANQQSINSLSILELGAGSGVLMNDILKTFNVSKEATQAINSVNILEINKNLQKKQQQLLAKYNYALNWQEDLSSFTFNKESKLAIIANEFLDALATKQFEFKAGNFYERLVTYKNNNFNLELAKEKSQIADVFLPKTPPKQGDVLELSQGVIDKVKQISALLKKQGGFAILIDYGYTKNMYGESIQAIKNHKYINFLQDIGKSDITFHVNFNHVKQVALQEGLSVSEIKTQGDFLKEMGILERYTRLSSGKDTKVKHELAQGLQRLIATDEMGDLFKVIVLRYNIENKVCI